MAEALASWPRSRQLTPQACCSWTDRWTLLDGGRCDVRQDAACHLAIYVSYWASRPECITGHEPLVPLDGQRVPQTDLYFDVETVGTQAFFRETYDLVIAGASFAGLVAGREAARLGASVLVIDPQGIGAGQTSACATTLGALETLGMTGSVQQIHREMIVHLEPATGRRRDPLSFRLPFAFATFDYGQLCRSLAANCADVGVEFARARVTGFQAHHVVTDRGVVRGTCTIDAAGWRAPLATSIAPNHVRRDQLSCGLEVEVPQPRDAPASGLHFWAGHGTIWPGYAWAFPAGAVTRLGVLAFPEVGRRVQTHRQSEGVTVGTPANGASVGLRTALDDFMDGPGADFWSPDGRLPWHSSSGSPSAGRHLHGGFIPCSPRKPVVGEIMCVGDAAGHCFGLTAEGIRAAMTFAIRAGQLAGGVAAGRWSASDARSMYGRFATMRQPYFVLLNWLQKWLSSLGDTGIRVYSEVARPGPIFWLLMAQYRWAADPIPLLRHPV